MSYSLNMLLIFIYSLTQIFFPLSPLMAGGSGRYFENWSAEQSYTPDYTINIEKTPGKDFVILNFSDIQLNFFETYMSEKGKLAKETMDALVEAVKPDLITLGGDNAETHSAYVKMILDVDSYGIPWAPIMGNHEGQIGINEFWAAYRLSKAENCLFKFGPKGMGYGNYIINITENGKVIHSLFLMDTHAKKLYKKDNGLPGICYADLWDNQIEWYKWAVNGITESCGSVVESTILMHIPVCEYQDAWDASGYDKESGTYTNPDYADSFGSNGGGICCSKTNNGFFDVCKELGSTKNIICGHDHKNNSSILYEGIRLTYSLKCGPGSSWDENKSGGTTITVSSDGHAAVSHVFYPLDITH